MIYRLLFLLAPIALTCIPGYNIGGDSTIQAFDIYFAILLFFNIIGKRKKTYNSSILRLMRWWNVFVCFTIFSTLINSMELSTPIVGILLKTYRLLYPSFLMYYYLLYQEYFDLKGFEKALILSMIVSPFIGIFGYIFQIPGLMATQTAQYDVTDLVFNRAGSFWQEAGIFGDISALYILISIIGVIQRKKIKIFYITSLFLNIAALFLSGTRAGAVVVIVALAYLSYSYGKKSLFRFSLTIAIIFITIYILGQYDDTGVISYYIQRMTDVANINSSNAGEISSTRTVQWVQTLETFFNSDAFNLLCGYGYKTDLFAKATDNGYVYVLISTGLIGITLFLLSILKLLGLLFRNKSKYFWNYTSKFAFLSWTVSMLFADTLTYIPILVYSFLFISIRQLENNENRI